MFVAVFEPDTQDELGRPLDGTEASQRTSTLHTNVAGCAQNLVILAAKGISS